MSSQKKKRRRKSFSLPAGNLLDQHDEELDVSTTDSPIDASSSLDEDAREQQLKLIREVFGFERLAWKGFKTVLASILFFSVGTSLSTSILSSLFPNYFRFLFGKLDRIDFQPWIGGLAHGLVVGALAGAVIGCVVVLSVALYQSRSWRNIQSGP